MYVVNYKPPSTTDTAEDGSGAVSSQEHNLFAKDAGVTGLV